MGEAADVLYACAPKTTVSHGAVRALMIRQQSHGSLHLTDKYLGRLMVATAMYISALGFKLDAVESVSDDSAAQELPDRLVERSRIIPTGIKLEVWARDEGRCVTCGATDELHFDHILPYSKGGTSLKAANVQLLCARHNLSKSAKIQ